MEYSPMYPSPHLPPIHPSIDLFICILLLVVFSLKVSWAWEASWVPWCWPGRSDITIVGEQPKPRTQWAASDHYQSTVSCFFATSPRALAIWVGETGSCISHGERLFLLGAPRVTILGWQTSGHRVGLFRSSPAWEHTDPSAEEMGNRRVHSWQVAPPVNYVTRLRSQPDHLSVVWGPQVEVLLLFP